MFKQPWLLMLLTALAYFAAGRLALLLAIPPGFATAIWPAAGIAVAVLLLYGYRYWPAIALGSFLVNIPLDPLLSGGQAPLLASIQLPFFIASGAALQALVSVWLLRRFVHYPVRLDTTGSVLKFIVVVCGAGSMVSATVGVLALLQAGQLLLSEAPFNWFTWWVGDGLGVLLVSTLIFVFRAEPRGIWHSRRKVVVPVLLLATLVIVVLYIMASRWELSRQQGIFERHAGQLFQRTEAVLHSYFEGLYALQAFFSTAEVVPAEDFEQFVSGTLQRNPGFQGIAWNPVVTHVQRRATERRLSEELGETVVFAEVDQNGTRMRAERRDSYVVIRYIQPLASNRRALGYDISSNQLARRALMSAARRGEPAATEPIRLVQETGEQLGVVVYLPVTTASGRLQGYVSGVFRMGDVMRAVLAGESMGGVSLRLRSGGAAPETLYSNTDSEVGRGGSYFSQSWPIRFADRQWHFEVDASQRFWADSRSIMPWGVLASGLLFVGLLGMSLLVLTGAKYRAEESERELTRIVERLREAQGQLVEAEKLAALGGMMAGFAHELNTPIGIAITAESTLIADLEHLEEMLVAAEVDLPDQQSVLGRLREASRMALDHMQRAGSLIVRFKEVSVEKPGADLRNINLHDYLRDILLHLSPNYRRSGHEVSLDCPRDIYLQTSPGAIAQVVINLMNNALSHAFVDGQSGCISLEVERDSQGVLLYFRDNGLGMSEQVLEHIFEPFFTTRRGGATAASGLGLHLVYSIVRRQLGGEISVSSVLGEGSCFTIRLPLSLTAASAEGGQKSFDSMAERRSGFV